METKFKVSIVKDAKILQDFILFTYRAKSPKQTMKMLIMSVGLLIISYMAVKDDAVGAGIFIAALGVLGVLFALFRHKLALHKLKKADEAFKNQTKLDYIFTNSNIYAYENDELHMNVGAYSHVTCLYEDEFNIYVGVNNDDLFLLPRNSFVEGDVNEFVGFIEGKSGEQCEFLPATLKNKWILYRKNSKEAEAEYDAKAAAKRAEAKEKKARKKNR